jgi:hypothetical protein
MVSGVALPKDSIDKPGHQARLSKKTLFEEGD